MRTLKVGVVGCGGNSENHLKVYSTTRGVHLAAVCDIEKPRAEEKARKYCVERVLVDYDSMLKLDLDLIDIITPTSTHADLSKRALESGVNVLVEKPMALTTEECEDMIKTAKKTGRALSLTHSLLFLDSIRNTRAVIDKERLTVSRVRFSYFFAQPYRGFTPKWVFTNEERGILWEALVHHVYLCEHFLGPAQSVYAIANRFNYPVDDSITILLRRDDNIGIGEYQYDVKETQRYFQLLTAQGDRFQADLTHDFCARKSRKSGNRVRSAYLSLSEDITEPLAKWSRHVGNFVRMASYERGLPMEKSFFRVIRQFLAHIRGEEPSPPVRPEDGLRAIEVLEAAARSIETGKPQSPGK